MAFDDQQLNNVQMSVLQWKMLNSRNEPQCFNSVSFIIYSFILVKLVCAHIFIDYCRVLALALIFLTHFTGTDAFLLCCGLPADISTQFTR